MSTTFWDLCTDVILEICSYFSINELFFSFYPDVLPYLFELLTRSYINLHLCLTNDDLLTGTLLSLINIDQIVSLHVSFCDIPLNIFNAVKTITLKDVPNVNEILSRPYLLPSFERLILIYSCNLSHQVENALRSAFRYPSLKYLKLNLRNDDLLLLINSLERSSSIEQLIINASCSKSNFKFLFDSLPCLRVLQIRTMMDPASTTNRNQFGGVHVLAPSPVIYHLSLQIIDLVWYHPDIANLTALLTGLRSLKRCRLSGIMDSKELNGRFWYNLVTKICFKLTRINVNMLIWTGTETEEIKTNFDEDMFFQNINFKLNSSDKDEKLLTLIGDFRRSVQ